MSIRPTGKCSWRWKPFVQPTSRRSEPWLAPEFQRIDFGQENFAREASVIIPVRNRKRTIAEAVESALQQQTDFSFNVIVVDNHSTDGTGQILTELFPAVPQSVHHIPASTELGIGDAGRKRSYYRNAVNRHTTRQRRSV